MVASGIVADSFRSVMKQTLWMRYHGKSGIVLELQFRGLEADLDHRWLNLVSGIWELKLFIYNTLWRSIFLLRRSWIRVAVSHTISTSKIIVCKTYYDEMHANWNERLQNGEWKNCFAKLFISNHSIRYGESNKKTELINILGRCCVGKSILIN